MKQCQNNILILMSNLKYCTYSRVQNSIERLFWAGNQGNHQNFEKNDTLYEIQGCFH